MDKTFNQFNGYINSWNLDNLKEWNNVLHMVDNCYIINHFKGKDIKCQCGMAYKKIVGNWLAKNGCPYCYRKMNI